MRRGIVLKNAWRLARAYWFSAEKLSAWLLLSGVISLNLILVYITVQLNIWQGTFFQVIQDYNSSGFIHAIVNYALLAILFIIVKGYQLKIRLLLAIHWRHWLTNSYLSSWLQKMTYYRLQLLAGNTADNPDQRISEDVDLFVSLTLRLSIDLLNDIVTIFSFILILWNLSGILYLSITISIHGYLVWAALIYAGLGTYLSIKTGSPLVQLDYAQQCYEANFRFSLVRIREHSESIAFYHGESAEKKHCLHHFQNIVSNFVEIIKVRKKLMWLTTSYSRISVIFAILVGSPQYFQRQIQLGQMFQIMDAYSHVQTGFSFIIDSFTRLAQWRAVVNRLNHFLTYMETVQLETKKEKIIYHPTKNMFCANTINVFRPDGYSLITGITLHIKPGDRLLITGPSGCGKSTLLRTLAKLWPFATGQLDLPYHKEKIMFVPQKVYMPIAQLRKVLLYPEISRTVSDYELCTALTSCKLSYLSDKLAEIQDWSQTLSLGEQQRIAFTQILLSKPAWLFLDEASSALDENTEQTVYKLITQQLPQTAIVSVGHRHTLLAYHTSRLDLDGKGNWHLSRI